MLKFQVSCGPVFTSEFLELSLAILLRLSCDNIPLVGVSAAGTATILVHPSHPDNLARDHDRIHRKKASAKSGGLAAAGTAMRKMGGGIGLYITPQQRPDCRSRSVPVGSRSG
jgi:hypothetical protein